MRAIFLNQRSIQIKSFLQKYHQTLQTKSRLPVLTTPETNTAPLQQHSHLESAQKSARRSGRDSGRVRVRGRGRGTAKASRRSFSYDHPSLGCRKYEPQPEIVIQNEFRNDMIYERARCFCRSSVERLNIGLKNWVWIWQHFFSLSALGRRLERI